MSRKAHTKTLLQFIPIVSLLGALVLYFYSSITYYAGAGRDDTFITLWTGISLAEGRGLVNYNFEPVEMSSSLLHTLVIGVIHILAPNFIYTINKVLGLLAGAAILILLHQKRHIFFTNDFSGMTALILTYLGLANSRSWLYWNLGGLETPFQTLILFLYGLYLIEFWITPVKVLPLVVLQILYLLVRPEGFLLIFFTSLVIFARAKLDRRFERKQVILLSGVPGFMLFTILIARYSRFGLIFPNPVYAKVHVGIGSDTISFIGTGLEYLRGFYTSSPYLATQLAILTLLLFQLVRILLDKKKKPDSDLSTPDFIFVLWFGLILLNHFFVTLTGGDWMEFFRFLAPVVPFLVVLSTCFAYKTINEVLKKNNLSKPYFEAFANVALGALFLLLISTNSGQRDNFEARDFHNCSETLDASKVRSIALDYQRLDEKLILLNCAGKRDWDGLMLFITHELPNVYELLDHKITITTFQMGFFPYYVKKIHPMLKIKFIDTLGIADTQIARMEGSRQNYGLTEGTRIAEILAGESGELSNYVLRQNPNLIYVLNASYRRRQILDELGWTVHLDKPGAVIFIKESPDNDEPAR